jgi:hypothetical protein
LLAATVRLPLSGDIDPSAPGISPQLRATGVASFTTYQDDPRFGLRTERF